MSLATRLILPLLLFALASGAAAVTTSHWTQTSEADFKAGTFHGVVATNLGSLKLSRSVKTLLEQDPKVGAVYSLAEAKDGTVYAGTGPQGVLLAVRNDAVSTVAEFGDGVNLSSLLVDETGAVWIGTSGPKGGIFRIDKPGDKPHPVYADDSVQYIWAMVRTPDGNVYAATGPTGTLVEIRPDGSHATLLKTDENNLLCMAGDGKDLLYVGTDTTGLVYRVNRKTRESFVLYNAAEAEIGALALDGGGNLYVGTAVASDQPPAADDPDAKEKAGHPEGGPGGVPIRATPPVNPAPPKVPDPNPGEPDPIPKLMMLLDDGPDGPPAPPEPTPPKSPTPPAPPAAGKPPAVPPQQEINPATTGQPAPSGNAIYKIDRDGFATEIFRGPVLVLSLVTEPDGTLLAATGSEGLVYQIKPGADETTVVAKVDAKQVTTLLPTRDGRVILGLANAGGLAAMGSGYADHGTYVSQAFDAVQVSRFGKMQLHGSLPAATTLTVATRSGNVKEPGDSSWGKWSAEQPAAEFVSTRTPAARFFQYRLTFASTVPTATASVDDVDVAYLMPNLSPQVKTVKVTLGSHTDAPAAPPDAGAPPAPAAPPANNHVQTVQWEASDPNNDPLVFSLYYRAGSASPWILLKDKLKETTFEWDTRAVADGRYEVKVVASDAAANPVGQGKTANRVSDTVLIDNTAPVIGDVRSTVKGSAVTVELRASDRTGTIAAVDYAVDSSQDWQAATPSDTMFDGPTAAATLTAAGLSPGAHEIAIRVTDARGNSAYQNVDVTVGVAATQAATRETERPK